MWIYKGELDLDGKVCGFGKTYNEKYPNYTTEGTFVNERQHGIAVQTYVKEKIVLSGEFKDRD